MYGEEESTGGTDGRTAGQTHANQGRHSDGCDNADAAYKRTSKPDERVFEEMCNGGEDVCDMHGSGNRCCARSTVDCRNKEDGRNIETRILPDYDLGGED